jgi:hypothetical protein
LGEKEHIQPMMMSENIDEGHSSTSRIEQAHSKITNESLPNGFFVEEVFVKTMDTVVKETGLIPDVIKVDIEGAEHLFLIGAQETLRQYKPILYIEFHSEYCAFACTEFLIGLGYALEVLHEEEDNRLIIKAYPAGKEMVDSTLASIAVNNFTSSANIQKTTLRLLNKCNDILSDKVSSDKKFDVVCQERDILQQQNAALQIECERLQVLLQNIYNSRGWKTVEIARKIKAKLLNT